MKGEKQNQHPKKKSWKKVLADFWDFVWNGDSFSSWIVSILLAFIVIRFIFYPLLGLAIGTSMPIVAVISGSMEHSDNWAQTTAYCSLGKCIQEEWYIENGITPAQFAQFPFRNGFNKGDIMIIAGKNPEKIKVGDVIVFQAGNNYPIIHRVVDINKDASGKIYFTTKGDNNPSPIVTTGLDTRLKLDETKISQDRVQGVAKARIPWLGYIKIAASDAVNGLRLFIQRTF